MERALRANEDHVGNTGPKAADLVKSEANDAALARFATAYANQTEKDFEMLKAAAQTGRVPVEDV